MFIWLNNFDISHKNCILDNCLDRQVERHPDRVAFIWEKDEPETQETFTYKLVRTVNGLGKANSGLHSNAVTEINILF